MDVSISLHFGKYLLTQEGLTYLSLILSPANPAAYLLVGELLLFVVSGVKPPDDREMGGSK